jgi:hypothetical protein
MRLASPSGRMRISPMAAGRMHDSVSPRVSVPPAYSMRAGSPTVESVRQRSGWEGCVWGSVRIQRSSAK